MKISSMFTTGDIISQIPFLLKWLESLGFTKAASSRYSRYESHISDFFAPNMAGVTHDNFIKASKALNECLDIVIIYKIFQNEKSKGFINRLSKTMSGPDFLDAEANGESRDFLFELVIAAKLKKCGYAINFDKLTDVVASKNGYTLYGECKRLSSIKQFENNFKKAGKQLRKKENSSSYHHYGLIFIDVSTPVLNSLPTEPVKNTIEANRLVKSLVDNFSQENMKRINLLNSRFVDSSLGVCFIGKTYVWTEPVVLYSVANYSIITKPDLSEHLFKVLGILLREFDENLLDFLKNNEKTLKL